MSTKKIKFISSHPEFKLSPPIPSSRLVPEWYRTMPGSRNNIETVKKCIPFLDALTSGYMITLDADVYWNEETKKFHSESPIDMQSDHDISQIQDVEIDDRFDTQPHKWINHWEIKTPKGYSCLFIHPLDRLDLPFYSITGIVDTDKHPLVINFPFLFKKGFSGVIPKGTPIIQVIPFKRDNWKSEISDDKPYDRDEIEYKAQNPPFGWYKRNWWTKKSYT